MLSEKEIEDKLEKGYYRVRAVIEIIGTPKEHVKVTMVKFLEKIEEKYSLIKKDVAKIKAHEDYFSTFAEVEFLAKKLEDITAFCFDYMPSSIEILNPERVSFSAQEASAIMNDFQGRLHHADSILKQVQAQSKATRKNLGIILKNFILNTLFNRKLAIKEISKVSGISEEDLENVLEELVKEKILAKEGSLYSIKQQ